MIPAVLCVRCKGRLWCQLPHCPILDKFQAKQASLKAIPGKEFEGSSPPGLFVSWTHYPAVSIAPLAPPLVSSKNALMDNPEQWFGFSSAEIVEMRSQLVQSKKTVLADSASNPSYDLVELQELSLSLEPVSAWFELFEKPRVSLSFFEGTAPAGPIGWLKKMSLNENPKIPTKVDYLVSDTEAKSQAAVQELYSHGLPVHYLSKILSAGTLGVKNNRKLVPTRWSITAVDDNVSAFLVEEFVKDFQSLGEVELFSSNHLGNSFFVLLVPGNWSFEMMECWLPGSPWTLEDTSYSQQDFQVIADFELYHGRKSYAENITGAYYAGRLAVAEHLVKRRRQACAVVFREVGQNYSVPLGVWVIRETVRNALNKKSLNFSDVSLALQYLGVRLQVPIEKYKKSSRLLDFLKNQKRILDFI